MDKIYFDIAILVGKYLAGNLTEEEHVRLNDWLVASERHRKWFRKVTSEAYKREKGKVSRAIDIDAGWKGLQAKRFSGRRRMRWIRFGKYAAVLLLPLLVIGVMYLQLHESGSGMGSVETIASGTRKAYLIMGDGTSVSVENQQQRLLEEKDGTKINVQQEHITYENAIANKKSALIYNELVIPRGGEFSLTLSDGTVVYLNAESKLRFPLQFDGNNRIVELEGEGYFQVVHDENAPFVVKTAGMNVQVLGTEFNVSAYTEDTVIQTTLVNGSVWVSSNDSDKTVVLKPGEQVECRRQGNGLQVRDVDVSSVIAWKDGRLRFEEKPLCEVMKSVARWYDVEVVYLDEEVKWYPFGCNFNRHSTIEPLLKVFEATGTVETRVEGRKIFIKKQK